MRDKQNVKAVFSAEHIKVVFTAVYVPDDQGQDYEEDLEVDSLEVMGVDIPKESWPKGLADSLVELAYDLEFS